MSIGLQSNFYAIQIPLRLQVVNRFLNDVALQSKVKDYTFLHLDTLALNANKQVVTSANNAAKAPVILLVLFAHIVLFNYLAGSTIEPVEMVEPATPMMVSIIAPPAPLVVPEPEIVPIVKQAEQVKKPIVKPKKLVKKIVPIAIEAQPLIEATTEPIVKELKVEEVVASAPIVEKIATETVVEERVDPPKFGVAYLNNPAPAYPRLSKRTGEEGRVLLKVLVSAEGNAESISLEKSSGFERLDKAAKLAVEEWRFVPARKGGQALSAYVLVPVKFSLGE